MDFQIQIYAYVVQYFFFLNTYWPNLIDILISKYISRYPYAFVAWRSGNNVGCKSKNRFCYYFFSSLICALILWSTDKLKTVRKKIVCAVAEAATLHFVYRKKSILLTPWPNSPILYGDQFPFGLYNTAILFWIEVVWISPFRS